MTFFFTATELSLIQIRKFSPLQQEEANLKKNNFGKS